MKSKELVEKYFYEHPKEEKRQVCLLCYPKFKDDYEANPDYCAEVKSLTKGNGYQWAKQHLETKHKGYDSTEISS